MERKEEGEKITGQGEGQSSVVGSIRVSEQFRTGSPISGSNPLLNPVPLTLYLRLGLEKSCWSRVTANRLGHRSK